MRYSIAGGGSDLPRYLSRFGEGVCLTTTLNQSVFVATHASVSNKHRLVYSEIEEVVDVIEIKHKMLREVLSYFGIIEKVEIFSIADLPAKGTGLGASSAFCNALIASVSTYLGLSLSNLEIAGITSHIEMVRSKTESGYQDQYASALGGIKLLHFDSNGFVGDESIFSQSEEENVVDWLNSHTVFIKIPGQRDSSDILSSIDFNSKATQEMQKEIADLVPEMVGSIRGKNLRKYGELLDRNWSLKACLSPDASNPEIDDLYNLAKKSGAIGGKLLGAGASGYLAIVVEDRNGPIRQLLGCGPKLLISGQSLITKEI